MDKLLESSQTLKAAVAAGTLGKDKGFVESLLSSYVKYGGLSAKQEFWFHKMAEKYASGAPTAVPVEAPAPAPLPAVGQFEGVYALFLKAKEKLKFPKINLELAPGVPVVLHLAGPKSKKPGVINVTNGGKFKAPGSKWYGRVNPDGTMESFSGADDLFPEFAELKALLKELAASPAVVAANSSKLTGKCCFCNLPLSDEKSTAAGFGETCAKNYGLHAEYKAGVGLFEKLAKDAAAISGLDDAALAVVGLKAAVVAEIKEGFKANLKETSVAVEYPTENAGKAFADAWKDYEKSEEKPALEEKVNNKLAALSAALISPAKAAKVAKATVVSVPEPKKDEDYLF